MRVLITDDKIPWQEVNDDGTVPVDYGYLVRYRKEGRGEPIRDGYLLSGQDDIQGAAIEEWYLPRWIEIGENK